VPSIDSTSLGPGACSKIQFSAWAWPTLSLLNERVVITAPLGRAISS
jgi:hypothetical protein